MKKKKPGLTQKDEPKKQRGRTINNNNHWVIQVKGHEPYYFAGNEQKAEGSRMYHGVRFGTLAWKRHAKPEEIQQKTALFPIDRTQIKFSPKFPQENLIKKHYPQATTDQIQSARVVAGKHIERNTKMSEIHQKRVKEITKTTNQFRRRKK